jgi:hypothetical protein
MEAASLPCRQPVALEKSIGFADAIWCCHSRRERGYAIHVECDFASPPLDRGVLHEVRSGLSELRGHVFEGLHRRADLPELDSAHVRARVVGSAELRLAETSRGTCLTQALTQLLQRR